MTSAVAFTLYGSPGRAMVLDSSVCHLPGLIAVRNVCDNGGVQNHHERQT